MNKRKWDSLPEDIQKIIDETTGMAMSVEAGKVYDQTNEPMKQLCEKKGMQALQLSPEEESKLETITLPLRGQWVKDMEAKGMPGQAVLDATIKFIKE